MRQPVRTMPVPACSGADPRLDRRSSQRHYYDEACDPEFETTRPHTCGRLYQFLITHKFQTGSMRSGLISQGGLCFGGLLRFRHDV